MQQKYIEKIQDKVINLLKRQGEGDLASLSNDCCSEMARLVGGWIQKDYPTDKIWILKGENLKNHRSHDLLAVGQEEKITIIDPTVWQFFPEKDILVGDFENIDLSLIELSNIYGGTWNVSEELYNITAEQMEKWEKTVRTNTP